MTGMFQDRREAGRTLAAKLRQYAGRRDVVVFALPRGGVPVAFEVAEALDAPLDLFLVRKLGTPGHRELAMGAIASGGIRVLNDDVVRWYGIPPGAARRTHRHSRGRRARDRFHDAGGGASRQTAEAVEGDRESAPVLRTAG